MSPIVSPFAARPVQRVELVNTATSANATRLQNLTIRILDASSNSVASNFVSASVAAGGNWVYTPPANTVGRYIKIGLENTVNGAGDNIVSLAEVNEKYAAGRIFCYKLFVDSY